VEKVHRGLDKGVSGVVYLPYDSQPAGRDGKVINIGKRFCFRIL